MSHNVKAIPGRGETTKLIKMSVVRPVFTTSFVTTIALFTSVYQAILVSINYVQIKLFIHANFVTVVYFLIGLGKK